MVNLNRIKEGLALFGVTIAAAGATPVIDKTLTEWFGSAGSLLSFIIILIALLGLVGFTIYELIWKGLLDK